MNSAITIGIANLSSRSRRLKSANPNMLPKILKIVFLSLVLFCLLAIAGRRLKSATPVYADTPLSREEWKAAVGDTNTDYTLEDNNQQVFNNLLNSVLDSTVGNDKIAGNTGALKELNKAIAGMIVNPPVQTKTYLADLGSSLGISAKPAYAQGIGWKALEPVLEIWKAFRNVAYLGFVVIFVLIGFMIMFRTKVNPQTVISIQEALPRIIITLLLVTFSYAIAGLMIDLIYILIYLIVGILGLQNLITNPVLITNRLLSNNLFTLIYQGNAFTTTVPDAINNMIIGITGDAVGNVLTGFGIGTNVLFSVIITVALLFVIFKLFISLLLCFVGIIVQVIFAPITLLLNALPGNNSFGSWIKGLLSNILPFPVIAMMFLLAAVLIGAPSPAPCNPNPNPLIVELNYWCVKEGTGYRGNAGSEVWIPPFLNLFGGDTAGTNPLVALIGIGIIFMMPKAVEMIKKALKVEEGAMATGIPAILSGVAAPIRTYQGYQAYRQEQLSKEFTRTQVRLMRNQPQNS